MTIEEMASSYVDALRAVQPEGPYLLGGHSFGGVVAFEMAQQLQRQGYRVSLLALMDPSSQSLDVSNEREMLRDEVYRGDDRHMLYEVALAVERYRGKRGPVAYEGLRRLQFEDQLAYVLDRLIAADILPQGTDLSSLRGLLHLVKANLDSLRRYRPQPYQGRVTLFCAQNSALVSAWTPLFTEPAEVYTVPGDHFSMLTEPHVKPLALQLQQCLDKADVIEGFYEGRSVL